MRTYVALFAGAIVLCLSRARADRRERAAWTALGAALALWLAGDAAWSLAAPRAPFPSWADALWLAGYPAAWAGLALLLRARVRGSLHPTLFLDGAIAATAMAAAVIAMADGLSRGPLDALWPLGALLVAAAASSPVARVRPAAPARPAGFALPAAFTAGALAIVVYDRHVEPVGVAALDLALAAPALLLARLALGLREHTRLLERFRHEAMTDALTGLGNRRALMRALDEAFDAARAGACLRLALFDLDGFKRYNDVFGHVAGDVLIEHLGGRLAAAMDGAGQAFRMGGDEFCVLAPAAGFEAVLGRAAEALREEGEGFRIDHSAGVVDLPGDAGDPEAALQLADRRMYARKESRAASAASQSGDVLLRALGAREPQLLIHTEAVAELARALATVLGLEAETRDVVARAAELHDVGKVAIPDAILAKSGPLNADEQAFMRRHTVIGEAIVGAAPALRPVAAIVRASHERWDGGGYPDGLAGEAIPLGARIVAVCDAFSAMVQDRPYGEVLGERDALAELRRCAGSQFDPEVVAAFYRLRRRTWRRAAAAPEVEAA